MKCVYTFDDPSDTKKENRHRLIKKSFKDVKKLIDFEIIHAKRSVSSSEEKHGMKVLSGLTTSFFNAQNINTPDKFEQINELMETMDADLDKNYDSFFASFLKTARDFLGMGELKVRSNLKASEIISDASEVVYGDGTTQLPEYLNGLGHMNILYVLLNIEINGSYETEGDRHGTVKVLYAVTESKPTARSTPEEKEQFQVVINYLIAEAQKIASDSKVLILTNKAIAEKNGFKQLYRVFDDRYVDVSDRIENYLRSIQALDVSDLCRLYLKGDFNELIRLVRKGGYIIHTVSDKKKLHDIMQGIIDNKNFSIREIVELAISHKLIKRTETYSNICERNSNFLAQLITDEHYQKFKTLYLGGQNTYSRIKDSGIVSSEEEFDYYVSEWKRERFIAELFSAQLKFAEVLNYAKYLDEETDYITMHKTKGTSIPSVIVVMEEYFWNEYDFSLLYIPDEKKMEKKTNTQKLFYVACSRAKSNLVCIKVLERNEIDSFLTAFPLAEEIRI